MSQDRLIPTTPAGEENHEERQQLQVEDEENNEAIHRPVEDEENTPEMAIHLGLPPTEALDLSGGNISANWKKFKQKYANYKIVTRISSKDSATRVATFNSYWQQCY